MKGQVDLSFRDCVRDCARDALVVASYNALYGTQLCAPISALVADQSELTPKPESSEGVELGRFILFCYDAVWPHLVRAYCRLAGRDATSLSLRADRRDDERTQHFGQVGND
jgi:hypothetical protein